MSPDLHLLAASYAIDALDGDELARFEAHLGQCDQCRVEVAELRATASLLAAASPVAPRPELRDQVMAAVARTRQDAPGQDSPGQIAPGRHRPISSAPFQTPRRRTAALVSVAAAVAIVVGAIGATQLGGDGPSGVAEVAAAADARQVPLDGAVGTLKVVWSTADGQVAVVGHGLPDPGPGQAYQLWLLGGDAPLPAGVFHPDGSGSVEFTGRLPGSPDGWGVTIEPASGSDQPTSDILYQGSV